MDEVVKLLEKLCREYQSEMSSAETKTKRIYCFGASDALTIAIRKIKKL